MRLPFPREFHLSTKEGLGVRCDASGAFVGDVALLERNDNEWSPRASGTLSSALSKAYGLPVDVSAKQKGLITIAGALNAGDLARAQIATLFAHFPDPPNLAKRTLSQDEIVKLALALDWAGLLKINTRHYPAKTPGSKGGQFAPKDADAEQDAQNDVPDAPNDSSDLPREGRQAARAVRTATRAAEEAAERQAARSATTAATEAAEQTAEGQASRSAVRAAVEAAAVSAEGAAVRLTTRQLFREAALDALKSIGKKLVLSEIPVVGQLADIATVFDVIRFGKQFIELRQSVIAATRFVNEGAHTLADLRVSQDFQSFKDYAAFLKIDRVSRNDDDLEKRFGRAGDGMNYHHIIERESGASKAVTETTENIVRIPAILHEAISGEFQKPVEESGGLPLREWLRTQPDEVKRYWGLRVLRKLGIIVD